MINNLFPVFYYMPDIFCTSGFETGSILHASAPWTSITAAPVRAYVRRDPILPRSPFRSHAKYPM